MTFDERLERISGRHKSLARSVEMRAVENRSLAQLVRSVAEQLSELGKFIIEIAVGTARSLLIAEVREHRFTRLEGQL